MVFITLVRHVCYHCASGSTSKEWDIAVHIIEVEYCSNTRYLRKLQEEEKEQSALTHEVSAEELWIQGGIEHAAANKLIREVYEHSVVRAHSLNRASKMLKLIDHDKSQTQKKRADPPKANFLLVAALKAAILGCLSSTEALVTFRDVMVYPRPPNHA